MLLLHRTMSAPDISAGIRAALTVGAVTADVVAVEARLAANSGGSETRRHPAARENEAEQRVVSLTQRRLRDPEAVIAGLPPDRRPLPDLDRYDQLLRRRTTPVLQSEGMNG